MNPERAAQALRDCDPGARVNFDADISDEHCTSIALEIGRTGCQARILSFSKTEITAAGARAICRALSAACRRGQSCLEFLEFSNTSIGDGGAEACAELLRTCCVDDNGAGESTGSSAAGSETAGVVDETGSNELRVAPEQRPVLSKCLLRSIDLGTSGLTDKGVGALAEALALTQAPKFEILYLWENKLIGDASAVALAEVLRGETTLKLLYLSGTCISDVGVTALAESLRYNTGLRTLQLAATNITNRGALALLAALRENNATLTYNELPNCVDYAHRHELDLISERNRSCEGVPEPLRIGRLTKRATSLETKKAAWNSAAKEDA